MTPQSLKASILQLAIQGKLVEQRPEEGTEEELYRRIQAEKQRLVKAGKLKKEKPLPEITEDEKPFEIPESWRWVRIGGACTEVFSGKSPAYEKEATAFRIVGQAANQQTGLDYSQLKYTNSTFWNSMDERYFLKEYDVLLNTLGNGTLGRSGIIESLPYPLLTDGHLFVFRTIDHTSSKYLFYYLQLKRVDIEKTANGSTNQTFLSLSNTVRWLFPLPPLAEQKRIVAKIEELLPLIDRYAQAWSKLEDFNKRFPGDMQKSLLQMAIQGKLVEQRPEEGTGEELAHALRLKKKQLIQSGQIAKKANTKPFYTQEELCEHGIPDTWCWVQLSDVSVIQEGAGIRKWQYRDNGTQILCVTNILEGAIDLERKKLFISTEEYLEKYQHLTPQNGDIVSACSGGSWGKTAIFNCSNTMMLNTSTLRMRFFGDLASNGYLYYLTKSAFFKKQLERQLAGMQPNFGYAHYSRIMLPLPPLAEQKRIVAKLEELLPLCERLK